VTFALEHIAVFIEAVIGPNVRPRGEVRYRVTVTHMDGSRAVMEPVRTHCVGPTEPDGDDVVYVRAADVGSTWGGCVFDGRDYQFWIFEERDFGPCDGVA
jgi:hypothetical protein